MTKNIDWGSLSFKYQPTDYRVTASYKDGKWSELELITDPTVHISECAPWTCWSRQTQIGFRLTAAAQRFMFVRSFMEAAR